MISMFANKVGTEIADRLYNYYLEQNWLFHASGSSAQLTRKIAVETQRVTGGILTPLMQMNARIILALLMILSIFTFFSCTQGKCHDNKAKKRTVIA